MFSQGPVDNRLAMTYLRNGWQQTFQQFSINTRALQSFEGTKGREPETTVRQETVKAS
jgi:hypothetical protein